MGKRIFALVMTLVLIMTMLPVPTRAAASLPSSIYLKQETNYTCTLSAAAMMLRARMYLSGNNRWNNVTESSIKSSAWVTEGLLFNWSYSIDGNSMTVSHTSLSGISVDSLKALLDQHPEGIVLYVGSIRHAVFVTDYEGDTFYCADPASGYSGKRMVLSSSWIGYNVGNQSSILNKVTAYWYIDSYSIRATLPTHTINYNPQGGSLPTASLSHELTGINTERESQALVIYDGSGSLVNTNQYGVEVAVAISGEVTGQRLYGSDSQLTVPSGGFVLSGQGEVGSFVEGIAVGDYVGYNPDSMMVYVYHSKSDYDANHKRVLSGEAIGTLPVPTRTGYIFNGWYSGNTFVDASTVVSDNMILYADWQANNSGTCGENLTWVLDSDGTLTISGTGAMGGYSNNQDVPWFECRENITRVVIEKGVTNISWCAFFECSNLVSIVIPDSVTSIEDGAFTYCSSLSSVTIPGSVTNIGNGAFIECSGLTSVTMLEGVTSIADSAFRGCSRMTSVVLPVSITSIGEGAFRECSSLTDVYYGGSVEELNNISYIGGYNQYLGGATFHYNTTPPTASGFCGNDLTWMLDEEGTLTIAGTGAMTTFEFGDAPWFDYRENISSIVMETGVTSIGSNAFLYCVNLASVTIPKGITDIGTNAFRGCIGLTGIVIPEGVTSIGDWAFEQCIGLSSIVIPEGVTSIEPDTFNSCSGLTSVLLPVSITNIGVAAFYACTSLTDIHYGGSETQWNAIAIGEYNYLDRATIHFTNTPPDEADPTDPTEGTESTTPPTDPTEETKPATPPTEDDKPVTPPVSGNLFVDVSKDAYYFKPVQWAVNNGITNGMDATHFAPDGTCTRAQIVTFLWRANGSPKPSATNNPFTDVPAGQWYTDAVLWAVEKGITTGTSATTFSPDAGCTRGQVATFLWRSQTMPASVMPVNSFTDINPNAYYYNAVLWAVENGITNGLSATAFGPDATCTRGQIVTFLYRNDSVQQHINRYTFHAGDVTWSEANEKAKELGGHLVHLNSIGEMGYLMARIYEMDYEASNYILLGGRRDLDEVEYYWADTDGSKVGGSLNEKSSWENALWLMGEPSLGYAGEWEDVMAMQYSDKDGRWGWNDVPDDLPNTILKNDPSKLGTIVYIVEYDD